MKIVIETPRLILREMLEEDEAGMFELDSDPEVHRYLGNQPVKTLEESRQIIRRVRQQYIDNGIGRWAVIERSSGSFTGWTGLRLVRDRINKHIDFYDLGYRFIKRYWGMGYATETALVSLEHGFTVLGLNEIYAMAHSENEGSNHVLRKAGLRYLESFDYEGLWHHWYRLTREEWGRRTAHSMISH